MSGQESLELLSQIRRDAQRIAAVFQLKYKGILAEHPRVKSRYGVCYADGLIKIRLNHARTGKPLKYSSLIDTLCHELAHLKYFNHGPEFKRFFFRILSWARKEGIYRPRPVYSRSDSSLAYSHTSLYPRKSVAASFGGYQPLGPLKRNGVPVFAPEISKPVQGELLLPWEQQYFDSNQQHGTGRKKAGGDAVDELIKVKPVALSRKIKVAPEQLSLF